MELVDSQETTAVIWVRYGSNQNDDGSGTDGEKVLDAG